MLRIETDPSAWGKDMGKTAIRELGALKSDFSLAYLSAKPESQQLLSSAVRNLNFVNDEISPIVSDVYDLYKKKLQFGYSLRLGSLSLFGRRLITYNFPELSNRLGFAFAPGRKPAELTEDLLARLYAGVDFNAVEGLGKLSLEEVVEKFEKHIVATIK